MIALFISLSAAYDADALIAKVEETRAHRSHRLSGRAPTFTDDQYRRAAGGRILTGVISVEGHAAKIGWGLAVIDVGVDAMWSGINSEMHHMGIVPLSHVEITRGSQCADQRQVLMAAPVPWVTDRFWLNTNTYNGAIADASGGVMRELVWQNVDDPASQEMSDAGRAAIDGLVPVGFSRGAWFLVGLDDGHTLVEYYSWVDPGGSVPAGLASRLASSSISDVIEAMETYSQGSPYCAGRF